MDRVHEQCPKIDSGTVLSQTGSKQVECTKCTAHSPTARPGRAPCRAPRLPTARPRACVPRLRAPAPVPPSARALSASCAARPCAQRPASPRAQRPTCCSPDCAQRPTAPSARLRPAPASAQRLRAPPCRVAALCHDTVQQPIAPAITIQFFCIAIQSSCSLGPVLQYSLLMLQYNGVLQYKIFQPSLLLPTIQ